MINYQIGQEIVTAPTESGDPLPEVGELRSFYLWPGTFKIADYRITKIDAERRRIHGRIVVVYKYDFD